MSAHPTTSIHNETAEHVVHCTNQLDITSFSYEVILLMGVSFIIGSLFTTLCLVILDGIRLAMHEQESSPSEEH
ncbi:MAG: hypothetical protein EAZ74_05415 [Alphaproteobacteria bacterium]|nr:MAG: hypothetical protein EAY76_05140 [Alphaproteobacteria bacterium]TAF13567.1 MAG: hypothetical protein EAZ74_05415 [Alphaproteobacteria bacterium]TAF75462.1 MAG: hypothetical protein EAZ52_06445 [Alphaproteobacteria bacterium]